MVNGGSIGNPSFKQIVMQKQAAQEGLKITGYDKLKQDNGKSKEKKQKGLRETSSNPKMKEKESDGKENSEKKDITGQKHTSHKEKQIKEGGEWEEGTQSNEEEKQETVSNPSNNTATSGACKPKKSETLRVVITDPEIQAYREHMSEHAVICKFMGLWPTERALCQWIRQQWKPKGDVKLHLGVKGFFTIVFMNLEDKDRVFDGGPYFFASVGLYMRP